MRRLVRSPAATWRRLPDGVVLALPGAEAPLHLNRTGALVWDELAEIRTDDEIATSLAVTCETGREEVGAALGPLLRDLLARGAIREIAS